MTQEDWYHARGCKVNLKMWTENSLVVTQGVKEKEPTASSHPWHYTERLKCVTDFIVDVQWTAISTEHEDSTDTYNWMTDILDVH